MDQALAQQKTSTAPVISASTSLNSEAKEFNPFRSSLQRSSSANNAFSGANNNNPSRSELKTNNNTVLAESAVKVCLVPRFYVAHNKIYTKLLYLAIFGSN